MTPMDTEACAAGLELTKTDLWGKNMTLYVKIDKKSRNRQICIRSPDLRWLADVTISCNEINTGHPQGTENEDA